jgi:hypothetical protein
MGYVYTPSEFEEGKIPTTVDFRTAMSMLMEGLTEMHEEGGIYGANIHGSNFNRSGGGVGSDIDALVILNSGLDFRDSEEKLRRLQASIKNETHVFVDLTPLQRTLVGMGVHHLNYYYLKYISQYCKGGIIGKAPILIIKSRANKMSPVEEIKQVSEIRLSALSKERVLLSRDYDENHCRSLEKYMRQTIYAAVDVLNVLLDGYPAKDGVPMSKGEICNLYKKEVPEVNASGLFVALNMMKKYRRFLRERVGKTVEEYMGLLKKIDDIYPSSISFMEDNVRYLHSNF